MGKIVLLRKERKELRKIARRKSVPASSVVHAEFYFENKLIKRNVGIELDAFNHPVPDGTVSVTEDYYRYVARRRHDFSTAFWMPIAVSAATTVVLYTLQQLLLPEVLQALRDLLLSLFQFS